MAIKKGGLGRGIEALLPQSQSQYSQSQDSVQKILTELIQPNRYQPRRDFDSDSLNELAESIKSYGILQPLIVRAIENNRYELIAGERRLRAAKIVGLEKIPVIIRNYTDAQTSEISIIENVQREDLNVIEEAQAYERLIKEFGHTQELIASKIGRSRSHIANILRLLKLSPTVRKLVEKNFLTLGQARPLLAIEDESLQVQTAEIILSEGLSARKVEAFVNEIKNSGLLENSNKNSEMELIENVDENEFKSNDIDTKPASDKIIDTKISEDKKTKKIVKKNIESSIYIREAEDKLTEILGAKVKITQNKKSCRLQIDFVNEQDLSRIVENFNKMSLMIPNKNIDATISTKEEKIAALRKFSTSQNFNI